eukprot:gnl/TRDRNA2_/TRDRNA2_205606_c0_seq1.p1 gnl/TRDRNA2_/TRDRNA2_205606_c0~~gnl/TRDRNA2_/TRDRNA2_205606_c0_seq1.p1  ORF type:complete len:116 (+),score=5.04 gnl/TRDRNA2_/TRDRNA2_205606_c0_seq1:85-432(+)
MVQSSGDQPFMIVAVILFLAASQSRAVRNRDMIMGVRADGAQVGVHHHKNSATNETHAPKRGCFCMCGEGDSGICYSDQQGCIVGPAADCYRHKDEGSCEGQKNDWGFPFCLWVK